MIDMPQYPYIQVVLSQQSRHAATTLLIYSAEGAPDLTGVPPADVVFDYFLNARECIVQWFTHEAACFVLMFRDNYGSDHDLCYALSLRVAAGASLSGRETYRVLTELRKTLVEERRMSADAVDETLASCGLPAMPRPGEAWHLPASTVHPAGAPPCYRTYMSVHELETYLTFPVQPDYAAYSSVIYVPATISLRPGVEIARISSPLRIVYTIDLPAGVMASRPAVVAGERIVLTYNRDGYSPVRETVVAGKPSPFVTYEGARMIVRGSNECQMTFTRRIPFTVRSAKGGPVTGYTITVNGRPVNTMQAYIEVADQDLRDGSPVTVVVSSTNFVTEKLELQANELDPSRHINVMLQPLEQGITLRLDFGEGRIFETQISIEKNTPEYSQLHGGSFHGFHARRLTVPGGGEIYYIDVRSGSKPTAPSFDNVSGEQRPVSPHFDRTLPQVEEKQELSGPEDEGERTTPHRRTYRRKNIVGIVIGALAGIAVICAGIYWMLPKSGGATSVTSSETDSVTVVPADTAAVPVATVPSPDSTEQGSVPENPVPAISDSEPFSQPSGAITDDTDYLNSAGRVWHRDSLHTDSGRELYDALLAGDIRKVVYHPYFHTGGKATNIHARRVADILWASYGTSTQRSNEKALQGLGNAPDIDLHKLYETLARYKSPQPNTSPRPMSPR